MCAFSSCRPKVISCLGGEYSFSIENLHFLLKNLHFNVNTHLFVRQYAPAVRQIIRNYYPYLSAIITRNYPQLSAIMKAGTYLYISTRSFFALALRSFFWRLENIV